MKSNSWWHLAKADSVSENVLSMYIRSLSPHNKPKSWMLLSPAPYYRGRSWGTRCQSWSRTIWNWVSVTPISLHTTVSAERNILPWDLPTQTEVPLDLCAPMKSIWQPLVLPTASPDVFWAPLCGFGVALDSWTRSYKCKDVLIVYSLIFGIQGSGIYLGKLSIHHLIFCR